MSHQFDDPVEALARAELTPEELREVLDRLALEATEEMPTIGAVTEVTGTPPEVVGRILADIRGISFQEAFGKRLDAQEAKVAEHSRRLDAHEQKLAERRAPSSVDAYKLCEDEREIEEEMRKMAKERIWGRENGWLVFAASLFIMLIILAIAAQPPKPPPGYVDRSSYQVGYSQQTLKSGDEIYANKRGEVWVVEKATGKRRDPTSQESEEAMVMISMVIPRR